jgi:O-acetyl-ADP-ribose deacetylase (regulator of RNase III)
MIYFHKGDLLKTKYKYICHQVNCQGKMNSGVAKAIREKWPVVYKEYQNWYDHWCQKVLDDYGGSEDYPSPSEVMLGRILMVEVDNNQTVINMAAQQYYGYDGGRYTSYDAFWMCLNRIKEIIPKGSSIGFPDHIGCCRGGANWNIIKAMIEEVLGDDYEVHIYKLEESK